MQKVKVISSQGVIRSGECILDALYPDHPKDFTTNAVLTYNQHSGKILVESPEQKEQRKTPFEGQSYNMSLAHSETCFSRRYTTDVPKLSRTYDKGDMKLASCIVLQDKEGKVFLTLRSTNLKIFPNSWILPGGHIEPNESLEEGVIRELFEETGIAIARQPDGTLLFNNAKVNLRPFFGFESSIPPYDRETGKYYRRKCPQGHLIIYFHVKVDVRAEKITLNLQASEVAAAAWLTRDQLFKVMNRDQQFAKEKV